ncbi:MAG: hypothetical protein K0S56_656 [Microvirga sp.]|jgi:hypothetical protein|nr:hypothetical protein [Microvirga sp.]
MPIIGLTFLFVTFLTQLIYWGDLTEYLGLAAHMAAFSFVLALLLFQTAFVARKYD